MISFSINCSTFARNSSSLISSFIHISAISSGFLLDSIIIIPIFIRYVIAFTNSTSEILSLAHHPALFLTQSGISCELDEPNASVGGITIIPSWIRY